MPKRRYEILLPLRHNDGRPVAPEKFNETRQDLVAQFGAVSFHPQSIVGIWISEGQRYEDELVRLSKRDKVFPNAPMNLSVRA